MQPYITKLFFITLICFSIFSAFSQSEKKAEGTWLLNRIPPITSDEDPEEYFENFANFINSLLEKNITPQAFDRNPLGEMILLSQSSPPAYLAKNWAFQLYESEKEMLEDIEAKSKERVYPVGFDTQRNGAFVLFLRSRLTMKGFRLIKIAAEEIPKSVNLYLDLGFIPIAMSSFGTDIWIMFASFREIKLEQLELQIKSVELSKLDTLLDEALSNQKSQLLAFTITNNNNLVYAIFHHDK